MPVDNAHRGIQERLRLGALQDGDDWLSGEAASVKFGAKPFRRWFRRCQSRILDQLKAPATRLIAEKD